MWCGLRKTLRATGMGFFALCGSTAALVTTLPLADMVNCIGTGSQGDTHTRWLLVANNGTGAPTLVDIGASFAITTGGVLTLFIGALPNGSSVGVPGIEEVSGRGLRAGDHCEISSRHAIPVAAAVHDQRGDDRCRHSKLRRAPP